MLLLSLTSILKPNVAVLEIVSRHTMYRGFVTPLARCSSSLGASLSICIIFSYMSLRNFGFSFAFDSSSSRQVRTPILQSITHGSLKSLNKSCNCKYTANEPEKNIDMSKLSFQYIERYHLHSPSSLVTWPLYSGTYGRRTSRIKYCNIQINSQ